MKISQKDVVLVLFSVLIAPMYNNPESFNQSQVDVSGSLNKISYFEPPIYNLLYI